MINPNPNIYLKEDTICALSTPQGRGAIAVIRLTGPGAIAVTKTLFQSRAKADLDTPRYLIFGHILDPETNEAVDDVLCTSFKAPASYTGENMVEIHCHGSEAVVRKILDLLHQNEIRLAEPGEFTFRAVRNGKLDLTQAEAVVSLIDSRSQLARSISLRMLEGAFSKELAHLKSLITDLVCELETAIEFPEDAEDEAVGRTIREQSESIHKTVLTIRKRAVREQRFEQGIMVVLAGKPNVGKSSIFNRLLGRERAIVTPHPGTTRDSIEGTIELSGRPVTLVETAGLRETKEEIESIGVQRSQELLSTSHVICYVIEAGHGLSAEEENLLENLIQEDSQARVIVISNKADLCQNAPPIPKWVLSRQIVHLASSATEEQGIDRLLDYLETEIAALVPAEAESSLLINARQDQVLSRLSEQLKQARDKIAYQQSHELAAEELRNALKSIAQLDGTGITPDIMDLIFSRFCIGK
ncbi:tRNA uridine-5-carboxymethylaminomethyl(34) synthesis GTPase MnmE [bacterium]|nr:tRNA uridine-5-carboxymethylaminomethyl(34) synthesis GTPase MnmE [bacterium]